MFRIIRLDGSVHICSTKTTRELTRVMTLGQAKDTQITYNGRFEASIVHRIARSCFEKRCFFTGMRNSL